jgi:hypothetical protein
VYQSVNVRTLSLHHWNAQAHLPGEQMNTTKSKTGGRARKSKPIKPIE